MPSIQELVDRISAAANAFSEAKPEDQKANEARIALRLASWELHKATTAPIEWVVPQSYGDCDLAATDALIRLGVLHALPEVGQISYVEVAAKANVELDVLQRLCRYTATFGFLKEATPGYIEHTEASRLAAQHSFALSFATHDFHPASFRIVDALRQDPAAVEPNSCAYSINNPRPDGSLRDSFQVLAEDPDTRERFTKLMQLGALAKSGGSSFLKESFNWQDLPAGSKIVDVGGGRGHMTLPLAESYPHLKFFSQDRAEFVAGAKESDLTAPNGASVEFVQHDFFTLQDLVADVYLFRRIFHDWSDKYCTKILQALKPALKVGTRLLINERVLPEPRGRPDFAEYEVRKFDLCMLVMCNGKERSLEQWKTLVTGADPSWKFVRVAMLEEYLQGVVIFQYV
ncbi:O-methyltransferase AMT9 [Pseudocercospora fuligena]|uniref:O-methyltransferase AMT9 n=1 Tax=Pseudocercospora fuligena TaxID=685502 RepID=A0A8H6RBH0_9PEZI|nr:O-methyltransferase AMT9 [Pseudocercospora fuligena]